MKVLVCIKQVPDMDSKFTLNSDGTWFNEADLVWRMNEYDEYAIEQAVQLKEQLDRSPQLTILSVGPDRVKETIKKALALGGDAGVHVKDDDAYCRTPAEIASIIYSFAKDQGFDLIFTGMQSQDRGSAQVGVLLGELLGVATITTVVDFVFSDGSVTVKRELEGGMKAKATMRLPALVTCQSGLNTPRYPTLPNIMKAKKKELQTLPVRDFLNTEPLLSTEMTYFPDRTSGGIVLEGESGYLADKLITIIIEKTSVLK